MVQTASTMQPLGSIAPDFTLADPYGKQTSLESLKGAPATLVMFICNHCPYVKKVKTALSALASEYQAKGVAVVAINSNDFSEYPDDSPEFMKQDIEDFDYTFPYLVDETQDVAKEYGAACTPDFFLYDKDMKLAYRGQMDNARPSNMEPNDGADLRNALDLVLKGEDVPEPHIPSLGCNIKWKA